MYINMYLDTKKNVFCLSITPLRKLYLFKMCARVSESVILYDNKL